MNILCLILGLIAGTIAGISLVDHPRQQYQQRAAPIAPAQEDENDDPEEPVTIRAPYGQSLPPASLRRSDPDEGGATYGPPVRACRGGCPYAEKGRP